MVIDKTTGRGCALSISSKTVVKKMIAEGIIGKAIYKKQHVTSINGFDLLRVVGTKSVRNVYVMSEKSNKLVEEPLWTPSFIEAGIWKQAVSRFPTYGRLDKCVEKYLLPGMEEYLQSLSDAELVSITRDFLITHRVLNRPVSQRAGKSYYFNEDEVYCLDKKSEIFPYKGRVKFQIFKPIDEPCFNMNVWSKAVSRFEVGMTLKECIGIFLQTELAHNVPQELTPIERLIQSIGPPTFERIRGNNDEGTFDFIRVNVGLPRYHFKSWEALQNEVEKYQHEIYQLVIQKLEKDRQLKRFGVPVNFLQLSDVTLLRDFSIEFIFELKKLEAAALQEVKK